MKVYKVSACTINVAGIQSNATEMPTIYDLAVYDVFNQSIVKILSRKRFFNGPHFIKHISSNALLKIQ